MRLITLFFLTSIFVGQAFCFQQPAQPAWDVIALRYIPVDLKMIAKSASLIDTLHSSGALTDNDYKQIKPVIQEASEQFSILNDLCLRYKTSPSTDLLAKIEVTIKNVDEQLYGDLLKTRISDMTVRYRFFAGINILLYPALDVASHMPEATSSAVLSIQARAIAPLTNPNDFIKRWNHEVCAPTGKKELEQAFQQCRIQ